MSERGAIKTVWDRSDRSDLLDIERLFRADMVVGPSDQSDRPAAPCPTGIEGHRAETATEPAPIDPAEKVRPLHTVEDAAAYADFLRLHGPQTYGAVAASLGWGASRAWRAEAELRARGRLAFDHVGRASLKEGETS